MSARQTRKQAACLWGRIGPIHAAKQKVTDQTRRNMQGT
ncbi:hypothetical protein BVIET440_370002 [Burkholderia vietnamiensis]|jgi:hypothetical protein|nr:hypothetical protein BVI2075_2000004 [Burkholderia vietnamiensis]